MGIDYRALIVGPLDIAAIDLNGGPTGELDLGIDSIGCCNRLQTIGRSWLDVVEGVNVGNILSIDAALCHSIVKGYGCSIIVAEG